jgi:hypothetical protein
VKAKVKKEGGMWKKREEKGKIEMEMKRNK